MRKAASSRTGAKGWKLRKYASSICISVGGSGWRVDRGDDESIGWSLWSLNKVLEKWASNSGWSHAITFSAAWMDETPR